MKYPGVYRGIVVGVDPVTLTVRCTVPSVTLSRVVSAVACVPPGWHDALTDLLQDHTFTDMNDGTDSTGDVSQTLHHRLTSTTPRPNVEGVWVMYEEGEVEHPVWIGTYKLGGH